MFLYKTTVDDRNQLASTQIKYILDVLQQAYAKDIRGLDIL